MCAAIGFPQTRGFSCKCVPILFRSRWEQNMSISPNLGPDRCDVHVLEQARHQARHDNEHACGSGFSNERDNVIGFLAFNGQR